jgi:hypothetical protein
MRAPNLRVFKMRNAKGTPVTNSVTDLGRPEWNFGPKPPEFRSNNFTSIFLELVPSCIMLSFISLLYRMTLDRISEPLLRLNVRATS